MLSNYWTDAPSTLIYLFILPPHVFPRPPPPRIALSFPNNLGFSNSSDLFWLNNKSSKFPFHVVTVVPPLLGM